MMKFYKMLVDFADYCRENGFEIPTSILTETVAALTSININKKQEVFFTLRQLWVKDVALYEKFKLCFDDFFYYQILFRTQEERKKRISEEYQDKLDSLNSLSVESKFENNNELDWLFEQLDNKFNKQGIYLEEILKNELFQKQDLVELKENLSKGSFKKELDAMFEELTWNAIAENKTTVIFDALEQSRSILLGIGNEVVKIKTEVLKELSNKEVNEFSGMRKMVQTEYDVLSNRQFTKLKNQEIQKLRNKLEESTNSFLTRFSKILKGSKKEAFLNLNKTIKTSTSTLGVPVSLVYEKPKVKKTKIDILLDVSGSVSKSAEFLTLFAFLLHKQFPNQVRVFSFVGLLNEVTDFFETDDVEEAIMNVLKNAMVDYRGYSNYGQAFSIYANEYAEHVVNEQTIIMVLGDARNNRHDSGVRYIQELKKVAKNLIWFNPEPNEKWGRGDSFAYEYLPYFDAFLEVRTLQSLIAALDEAANIIEYSNSDFDN